MSERTSEIKGVMEHMKKSGVFRIVVFGLALGILFLLIGRFAFPDEEKADKNQEPAKNTMGLEFFKQYKVNLEEEAEALCKGVSGVKSANAAAFFEGIGGSIYAQNVQSGSQEKKEYVIVGSGSNAHALYIGEELPRLTGIGIVCDTGGNESVRNQVAMLMAATYGVPLTRVYVAEGK